MLLVQKQNLTILYSLILSSEDEVAKDYLLTLHFIDTRLHLALPDDLRHLWWDIYECLVARQLKNLNREELLLKLNKEISKQS
jgi:hypothetical protein